MADFKYESFVFYESFFEAITALPDDEQLEMFKAVCSYGLTGVSQPIKGYGKAAFLLIKPQIDANIKRRENGKKGGAPKGNTNAKKQPETTEKQPSDNQKQPNVNVNVNDNVNNIPPLFPKGGDRANLFEKFYSAYPKHQAKKQALKAFEKLNPDEELFAAIMAALENQKQSDQWQRDNGQFIPLPASWLNWRRWEDEPTADGKADKPQNKELTPEEKADIWEFINQ